MINYNPINLFRSREFNNEFNKLLSVDGPLYYILKNYPNVPAKGGKQFPEYKDTTYFIHVLNTLYIGGLLLENELLSRKVNLSEYIYYIKLFFASCVYHDFNKLEARNVWKPDDYIQLLNNKKQVLIKMIFSYFLDYNIDNVFDEMEYIILNVENQSKDSVNTMNINNKGNLLLIARYASRGDSISSKMSKNISEFEILGMLEHELSNIPDINSIQFQIIPQTLLRNIIIREVENYFTGNIIIKSPDWIIVNKNYNMKELKNYIIANLQKKFNNVKEIARRYEPSNNRIDIGFYKEIKVTKEFLEIFMDIHKEKLLLYQKINDINDKYHIFDILKSWHYEVMENGKVKYFEDTGDENDLDIRYKSIKIRTAILRRMEINLNDNINVDLERKTFKECNIDIDSIDKLTRNTLIGLAYAFKHEDYIENTYNETMNRVLNIFDTLGKDLDNNPDDTYEKIIDKIFLNNLDIKNEINSKDKICIQCGGEYYNSKIERTNSFGIRATSGTGLKVSTLEYELYDGELCKLCELENSVRKTNFRDTDSLCIQMYTGDYVPPVDLGSILKDIAVPIKSNTTQNIKILEKNNEFNIYLGNTKIPVIDHHNLYFIEKPNNMISEFFLLKYIVNFIQISGVKIKLTTMFISGDIFYYTFKWESPPGWVKELSIDKMRIDEIDKNAYLLNLINSIASLGRGYRDLPEVISSLLQNKMNVYNLIWKSINKNNNINYNIKKFMFGKSLDKENILEEYEEMNNMNEEKSKMDELVNISCNIDNKKPESNNDNTWIIRTAFEIYERNRMNKEHNVNENLDDIKQKISGNLFDIASRRNNYSSRDMQNACIEFGIKFVDFINSEYGDIPKQAIKRDIISQFGLLYNIRKWDVINEKKSKNKEVKE